MDNYQIAENFSLLSKLMDIHGENSFKSKSYSVAAYNIEKIPAQLSELDQQKIFSLQGIGDAIGKKIIELLDNGKINLLEELINKTPPGVLEMLNIKGIGPKKISTIWKEMEIENIGELLYACHENRLLLYKGFGEKTQNNVKESIEFYQKSQGNFLYAQVEKIAEQLKDLFIKIFKSERVEITGAFKRQLETIEHLEFVVAVSPGDIKSKLSEVKEFELTDEHTQFLVYKYDDGIKIKIHPSTAKNFVETLFYTTGSDEFNIAFTKAYPGADMEDVTGEKDIFEKLQLQYIPPCLRETENIIEKATRSAIPKLIEPADIKGIIHCHSNWSDGSETLEQLAKAAIAKGLEYLVISDHSKTAYYANGLSEEKIIAQQELVDELNHKYKPFKIFKSIESDILSDGSLDYNSDFLATFDLVIASVHSNLKMNEEKAMARLIAAIKNPYTTILGHMTGRLLLSRNGFPVDYKKIIDACADNDVVIEVNAHPRRLDMRWQWLEYALEKKIIISIDPDAHSIPEFDNTKYGVLSAQKGLLTKENNLSSYSLIELERFLSLRKERKNL